jgi:hypothetical protein
MMSDGELLDQGENVEVVGEEVFFFFRITGGCMGCGRGRGGC